MLFSRCASFFLLLLYFSSLNGLGSSSSKVLCNSPLGLQDGRILNSQISSTSYFEHFYIGNGNTFNMKPEYARLNNTLAWCSPTKRNSNSTYIEIDLKQRINISAIATQGFMGINSYYVKQYKIAYSSDRVTWKLFKEVLTGNSDAQTVIKNTFKSLISARYLRVYPVTYNYRVCMRIELYGCSNFTTAVNPKPPVDPTITVTTVPSTVREHQSTTTTSSVTPTPTKEIVVTKESSTAVSAKATTPTPSSVTAKDTNHTPTSGNEMKEPLYTTTARVPWPESSQEAVVVAQTNKGVGQRPSFDHGTVRRVSSTLIVTFSIIAAFMVIVMVPIMMFLFFLRQRRKKRCKCPSTCSGDYGIPLTTAVIDESLCNQELYDTYRYGVPTGKWNTEEMNFLNRCDV